MTAVRIQIDLKNASVNVEAPLEAIDTIFDRLESFLPRLAEFHDERADADEQGDDRGGDEEEGSSATNPKAAEPRTPAPAPGGAAGRRRATGTRPESFKSVDLGLNPDQRQTFKDFFTEKQPVGQSQEVLVVAAWLSEHGAITSISREQIFTGLRTVGARVPTRVSSVLSNLVLEGYLIRDGKNFTVHHTGEDFVRYGLPKKRTDKKTDDGSP